MIRVLNAVIYSVPILLGVVFVYSALFRYPKPPCKDRFYLRLCVGVVGAVCYTPVFGC